MKIERLVPIDRKTEVRSQKWKFKLLINPLPTSVFELRSFMFLKMTETNASAINQVYECTKNKLQKLTIN